MRSAVWRQAALAAAALALTPAVASATPTVTQQFDHAPVWGSTLHIAVSVDDAPAGSWVETGVSPGDPAELPEGSSYDTSSCPTEPSGEGGAHILQAGASQWAFTGFADGEREGKYWVSSAIVQRAQRPPNTVLARACELVDFRAPHATISVRNISWSKSRRRLSFRLTGHSETFLGAAWAWLVPARIGCPPENPLRLSGLPPDLGSGTSPFDTKPTEGNGGRFAYRRGRIWTRRTAPRRGRYLICAYWTTNSTRHPTATGSAPLRIG